MQLIVCADETVHTIKVASGLVPIGFPEHLIVEVGDTIDLEQLDKHQTFAAAVLLALNLVDEGHFVSDDPHDESHAVQFLTLNAVAADLQKPLHTKQPLIERLTAYPDAISDCVDAEELKEFLPNRPKIWLEQRSKKLLETLSAKHLFDVVYGGFPAPLFAAHDSGKLEDSVYEGNTGGLDRLFRSRLNALYSATVRQVISTDTAAKTLRNVFSLLRDAYRKSGQADYTPFRVGGVSHSKPDPEACSEIVEILWHQFATVAKKFAVMYCLDNHREAFPLPLKDLTLAQANLRRLTSVLLRDAVPEVSVIELR